MCQGSMSWHADPLVTPWRLDYLVVIVSGDCSITETNYDFEQMSCRVEFVYHYIFADPTQPAQ